MRVFESSRSRLITLSAILLASLAFTAHGVTDGRRSVGVDVSSWHLMRFSFGFSLTVFAVIWAATVLFLLFARALGRLP